MRINLVTGGAKFQQLNSIDRLMGRGDEVIYLDNYLTRCEFNISRWIGYPRFATISDNNLKAIFTRAFNYSVMHSTGIFSSSNLIARFYRTFSPL